MIIDNPCCGRILAQQIMRPRAGIAPIIKESYNHPERLVVEDQWLVAREGTRLGLPKNTGCGSSEGSD